MALLHGEVPEVNTLHKRMLWASDLVHRMKRVGARSAALDHVWAGQCSCPYWHGVFGGIYLFHIREANYAQLIEAQTQAEQAAHTTDEWLDGRHRRHRLRRAAGSRSSRPKRSG